VIVDFEKGEVVILRSGGAPMQYERLGSELINFSV
jgi:hypothetical protein